MRRSVHIAFSANSSFVLYVFLEYANMLSLWAYPVQAVKFYIEVEKKDRLPSGCTKNPCSVLSVGFFDHDSVAK